MNNDLTPSCKKMFSNIHAEQWRIVLRLKKKKEKTTIPPLLHVRPAADSFLMNNHVGKPQCLSFCTHTLTHTENFHDCTFLVFVAVISEDSTFHLWSLSPLALALSHTRTLTHSLSLTHTHTHTQLFAPRHALFPAFSCWCTRRFSARTHTQTRCIFFFTTL